MEGGEQKGMTHGNRDRAILKNKGIGMRLGKVLLLMSVICIAVGQSLKAEGDEFLKMGQISVAKSALLNVKIGDDVLIAADKTSYGSLTDPEKTVVKSTEVNGVPVLNAYNLADKRFKFRREVALHSDGQIEITSSLRLSPYNNTGPSIAYTFSVPIAMLKGATFKAWTGKSARTTIVTGKAGEVLSGIRYIAFSGGKKDLIFDFNTYGASDWQDYCKWGFPTARWNMSVSGGFINFAYGRSDTFFGGTATGKVLIREGQWDFEEKHPYDKFSYHGATEPRKRFAFGALSEGLVSADMLPYATTRGWGWENPNGLQLLTGDGNGILDNCVLSSKGGKNVFLMDVPPGYYVLTARFCNKKDDIGPFSVKLNGVIEDDTQAMSLSKGESKTILMQTYAKDGKLRLEFSSDKNWCINSLAVQTVIYENEDFFLDRQMWMAEDLPDVNDDSMVITDDDKIELTEIVTAEPETTVEDWRWNVRMTHFGISVYDTRNCLVTPKNIERRIKEIKSKGYTAIMLDGWHMWPSMQDKLDDWTESTRRRVEIAHKYGLKVVDHFDVPCIVYGGTGFDFLLEHLDWAQRDIRYDEPTFRVMCFNNPGFRKLFLDFLEGYARATDIDAVMLDEVTFSGKDFCGCEYCRSKFTEDTGLILPMDNTSDVFFNYDSPLWAAWLKWRQKSIADWWVDVKGTLAKVRPDISIMKYTTHYGFSDRWAPNDLGTDMIANTRGCDFIGTEIMTRNILDSYRSVLSYRKMKSAVGRISGAPIFAFVYSVGNADLNYFGWALQHMNNQAALSSTIDGVDVDYYVKWPWQMRKSNAESIADVAILFSQSSRDFGRMMHHRNEALGISESMSDAHIQYDFILEKQLKQEVLSQYKMLILPSVMCMSPEHVAVVTQYVKNGGTLLCTGNSSMFNETGFSVNGGLQLRDVLGVDVNEKDSVTVAEQIQVAGTADVVYSGSALKAQVIADSAAEIKAVLKDKSGTEIGPGVITHSYGKGQTIYMPWNPGTVNAEQELRVGKTWSYSRKNDLHKLLVKLIAEELESPGFQAVSMPEKVVVSVYRQTEPEEQIMVHLLNATGVDMQPGQKLLGAHRGKTFPAITDDLVFDINLEGQKNAFIVSPDYKEKRAVKLEKQGDGLYRVTVRGEDVSVYGVVFFVKNSDDLPSWDERLKKEKLMGAKVTPQAEEKVMNKGSKRGAVAAIVTAVGMQSVMAFANGNLIQNPSAEEGTRFPSGWGRWKGAGKIDWGATADDSHSGAQSAYIKTLTFGEIKGQNYVGGALIVGGNMCKGVTGEMAISCKPNTEYTFSFWAKGDVPWFDVKVLGWKTETASKSDRQGIVTSVGRIRPGTEWKEYKGTFTTIDNTKKAVLVFYVMGYEDEGMTTGKTLYIDDVTILGDGQSNTVAPQAVVIAPVVAKSKASSVVTAQSVPVLATENMIQNPSAEDGARFPLGWGRWKGVGKIDWGATADDSRSGTQSAYLKTLAFGDLKGRNYVGGALIAGGNMCKGVTGEMAISCKPNTEYTFSFWAKGDVPWVDVKVLGWKSETAAKSDRQGIVTSVGRIRPSAEWKEYKGTFTTIDNTKKAVLTFYVMGYEDEGMTTGKTLYIDDVTILGDGESYTTVAPQAIAPVVVKPVAPSVAVTTPALASETGNMMPNSSAEDGARFPLGWGRWKGVGKIDWGATQDEAFSGSQSAFITTLKFTEAGGANSVGGGLIAGGNMCKGVNGEMAMNCSPNTKYTFSFWAKGDVPWVDVKVLGWKTETAAKSDRQAIQTSVGRIRPGTEWKEYKGTFTTTEKTRKLVLVYYIIGKENEGMSLNKTLYIDDVKLGKVE